MPSDFGPEELSELAECLDDACQESIRLGCPIGTEVNTCCPFGALLGMTQPFAFVVEEELGIPFNVVGPFMRGFDGGKSPGFIGRSADAFDLGRSFRERYVGVR